MDNLFPKRNQIANSKMEKMFLFFADLNKPHAEAGDISVIQQYIDYGNKHNTPFDWVQLHSGRVFDHAPIKNYPDVKIKIDENTNALVDKAIDLCKSQNVKVSYMIGDFSPLDEFFQHYPDIQDLNTGKFWEFIYDGVSALCKRFPKLDELGIYLFESGNLLSYTNFFKPLNYGYERKDTETGRIVKMVSIPWPYYGFADMIRMLVISIARACKDNGKTFCLLTHVWFPYQEELLYNALKDFPSDLPIMLEHNYTTGDFNPYFPFPGLIKKLPQMDHSVCYCCGMEYHGLAITPCCFPEAIQATVAQAAEDTPNFKRITVRPYWDNHSVLGTPNEINLYALLHLADNPIADMETVWNDWIHEKYNVKNEKEEFVSILRNSYEAIKLVNFTFGTRMNDHSHLPDFEVLETRLHLYAQAMQIWNPVPEVRQTIRDLLMTPGAKILRLNREAHEKAMYYIDDALQRLDKISTSLSSTDYADIKKRFTDMRIYSELHFLMYDSYIRILVKRYNNTNSAGKDSAYQADANALSFNHNIEKLKQALDKLKTQKEVCYLLSPNHIEDFIRRGTEEFNNISA